MSVPYETKKRVVQCIIRDVVSFLVLLYGGKRMWSHSLKQRFYDGKKGVREET